MGAGNVVLVLARWSPYLDDKPFRALVQMAVVSMDNGAPPRYWGGWPGIAKAVGASFPAECGSPSGKHDGEPVLTTSGKETSGRCRSCAAAQRSAGRSVKALLDVGVITLIERPRKGRNAEYGLLIGQQPTGKVIHRYGSKVPSRNPNHETLSDSQTRDAQRLADTRRSASPPRDAKRLAEEYAGGALPGIEAKSRSAYVGTSPAAVEDDQQQCSRCRWLAWEGHAPDCTERATA